MRPRPASSLFPYTTLFRSRLDVAVINGGDGLGRLHGVAQAQVVFEGNQRALLRLLKFVQDRKSTRLNSSHGYISYAVFCLKKKKLSWNSARTRFLRAR